MPSARRLFHVTYGNGRYLVADGNGTVFSSPDAERWTPTAPIDESVLVTDTLLTFGNGVFVRVLPGRTGIEYSFDGGIWLKAQTDGGKIPYSGFGVYAPFNRSVLGFVAGRFYLLGYDGVVWNSPNGQLWSETTLRVGAALTQFAFGNGRFVVAHSDNSGGDFTSTDGATWATQAPA